MDRLKNWNSWEAMRQCLGGIAVPKIARFLGYRGKNYPIIWKWMEAYGESTDSGRKNPAACLVDIMRFSQAQGKTPDDALAPLRWALWKFRRVDVELPSIEGRSFQDVVDTYVRSTKEMGDVITAVCDDVLSDGKVSAADARKVGREIREAVQNLLALGQVIKENVR